MRVTINSVPVLDEQEQLFLEVTENFTRFIEEYRRKHWFKELIYELTGVVDMDRIKAMLWYWRLVIALKSLRFFVRISPPNEETAARIIGVLEQLRDRLEVN